MRNELIRAVGLELADIRRSKSLSIVEVAQNTELNKDTISKYENGNSSMKLYLLDNLINYYGLNLPIFFKNVYDRMQKNDNSDLIQELEEYQEKNRK